MDVLGIDEHGDYLDKIGQESISALCTSHVLTYLVFRIRRFMLWSIS